MAKAPVAAVDLKRVAGERAAQEVDDGMVVGLGTGSTVRHAILRLGERVRKERLSIRGIPTSSATEGLAREQGIPLTSLADHPEVDLAIDGADEVDPAFDLVKGGGGALTREKVVAASSLRFLVVVDRSKLVPRLGASFPLPVEVVPMAFPLLARKVAAMRARCTLRMAPIARAGVEPQAFVTDNGNWIADCSFAPGGIDDKEQVERLLNLTPGVLDCGLFLGMVDEVIVGTDAGARALRSGEWV